MFDLHAVSIFATGTGESDTTTPPFLQVVEHNLQRNNQYNDYNDENQLKTFESLYKKYLDLYKKDHENLGINMREFQA